MESFEFLVKSYFVKFQMRGSSRNRVGKKTGMKWFRASVEAGKSDLNSHRESVILGDGRTTTTSSTS
jgi:hypothetical protein